MHLGVSSKPLQSQTAKPGTFAGVDGCRGPTERVVGPRLDLGEHDDLIAGEHQVDLAGSATPVSVEHRIAVTLIPARSLLLPPATSRPSG